MRKNLNCNACPLYNKCAELCPEAEKYVDQDNVSQRERLLIDNNIIPGRWPEVGTVESILKLFFLEQQPKKTIANQLSISTRYINKVIKQYKPIIASNIRKSIKK